MVLGGIQRTYGHGVPVQGTRKLEIDGYLSSDGNPQSFLHHTLQVLICRVVRLGTSDIRIHQMFCEQVRTVRMEKGDELSSDSTPSHAI